jgi:transposase
VSLAEWLRQFGVTQVAMESIGVYWKPVWNILERQFTVVLANAQHIKNVPGRKTDKKDAEWIAQLLQYGLLRPSYVPCEIIRDLRDLTRLRRLLDQVRFVEHEIALLEESLEDIGRQRPDLSQAVARWDTIPGVDRVAAWALLAEVGDNMAQFPTAEQQNTVPSNLDSIRECNSQMDLPVSIRCRAPGTSAKRSRVYYC